MADAFPFPTAGAPVAPAPVIPVATTVEGAPTEVAIDPITGKKPRKKQAAGERKTPAPAMNAEQIANIIKLIPTTSYGDIATQLGITKFQVNRVLMDTKKKLREAAGADVEKLAKVNGYIETFLSRPEDSRPGGGGAREGKVAKALDDIVGNILNGL
jgi:hypothetical protein